MTARTGGFVLVPKQCLSSLIYTAVPCGLAVLQLFDDLLWHGVHGGFIGRRFIVLKWASRSSGQRTRRGARGNWTACSTSAQGPSSTRTLL